MKQTRNVRLLRGVKADAHGTGAVNGDDLDLRDVKGDLLVMVSLDDKGAAGTLDAKMQDAADNGSGAAGTYADVSGFVQTQQTANGQRRWIVNRRALREWARVVITVGANAVDAHVSVAVMEPGQDLFADADEKFGL